jgi:hypothetical protein
MPKFPRIVTIAGLLFVSALPTQAATRIERELKLGPGGVVVLDASGGSIQVVGSSRSTVHVVITARRDIESDYDVAFGEQAGRATVRVERKNDVSHWFSWRGAGLRLEVQIPADAKLEVDTSGGSIDVEGVRGELRLATSGGSIRGTEVGGDVFADTSGGAIELEHVGGDVRAETSGGGIEIVDAGGDVRAETSGGGIQVLAARARVDADTSGGPVRVEFAPGNARGGSLSSSGGGVSVSIDPGVGLEVDASTSGGRVVSDVPVRVRGEISKTELRGTIGGGGALLKLRSSGGGIRIEGATPTH